MDTTCYRILSWCRGFVWSILYIIYVLPLLYCRYCYMCCQGEVIFPKEWSLTSKYIPYFMMYNYIVIMFNLNKDFVITINLTLPCYLYWLYGGGGGGGGDPLNFWFLSVAKALVLLHSMEQLTFANVFFTWISNSVSSYDFDWYH